MTDLRRQALRVVVAAQASRVRPTRDGHPGRRTGRVGGHDDALPGLDETEAGLWEE